MKKNILEAIIKHKDTENIEIDLTKAVKYFDDRCCISKWISDKTLEYRLIRTFRGHPQTKVGISNNDAEFLIKELKLLEVKNRIFRSGSTFYTKKKILKEIARLEALFWKYMRTDSSKFSSTVSSATSEQHKYNLLDSTFSALSSYEEALGEAKDE